jgi:hypothetical protein
MTVSVPEEVFDQLKHFIVTSGLDPSRAAICGAITQAAWVFGTAHAKSSRPFTFELIDFIQSVGLTEMLVLMDPEDITLYGLALNTSKEIADKIVRELNENGAAMCEDGLTIEGWQVYEA